jgi:hypothetical protein
MAKGKGQISNGLPFAIWHLNFEFPFRQRLPKPPIDSARMARHRAIGNRQSTIGNRQSQPLVPSP